MKKNSFRILFLLFSFFLNISFVHSYNKSEELYNEMLVDLRQYKSYLETEMTSGLTNSNDYNEWQNVRNSIRSNELYVQNTTIKSLVDETLKSADGYSFSKRLEDLDAYMKTCIPDDTCLPKQSSTDGGNMAITNKTDSGETTKKSSTNSRNATQSNSVSSGNRTSGGSSTSSSAVGVGSGSNTEDPPPLKDMFKMIERIFKYIFPVAGLLCVIFIIQGGYMWMTSSGEPEKIKQAQGTLTWAIIGLLFVILSSSILSTIVRLIE